MLCLFSVVTNVVSGFLQMVFRFSRYDVFMFFKIRMKINFIKVEITNPVIRCCQSTFKGCKLVSNICGFFFMICQKFEAPKVRYTLVKINFTFQQLNYSFHFSLHTVGFQLSRIF